MLSHSAEEETEAVRRIYLPDSNWQEQDVNPGLPGCLASLLPGGVMVLPWQGGSLRTG